MLPDQRPLRREKMICSILLLLSLTSCVSAGTFVVNVTQRFNQAEEKQNITLEWTFTTKPEASLNSLNISCQLVTFLRTLVLFHLHEGVEVSESQDQQFAGRVQFDQDVLREGRLRLHVSRLGINDSGLYKCEVSTDYGSSSRTCRLNVSAARNTPTGSGAQPESGGRMLLYCGLGLTAAALFTLC